MTNETAAPPVGGETEKGGKIGFWAPATVVAFLALTLAGTYFVRLGLLKKAMAGAMDLEDSATVAELARSFPCPLDARDGYGCTPLHRAAEWGDRALAELLLARGADVNAKTGGSPGVNRGGWSPFAEDTPLLVAIAHGHKEVAELLIAKGADVNARNGNRWTPLHEAAYRDRKDMAELLIAKGADTAAGDDWARRPLDTAAIEGSKGVAELLIAKGARLSADKAFHAEVLREAIESDGNHIPAEELASWIEVLLSAGTDVNVKDAENNTALLIAAKELERPSPALKVLLDAGADVNARDQDGNTALHNVIRGYAAEPDNESVKLLIGAGIDVNATNKDGDTAFADVAWLLDDEDAVLETDSNHTGLVAARLLLAAGAGKWKDYMGGPVTLVPNPPREVDPVVSNLTLPDKRNDAFRTILSWQKYRDKPSGPERIYKPVRHVVVCPQKAGPPIYAVFLSSSIEKRDGPRGPITLVDADGALISYYLGANFIQDPSEFKDINGDGVVEEVGVIHFSRADILHVLPVTRDQCPILNIVLKLKKKDRREAEWSWRLAETATPNVFSIEVGPLDSKAREIVPKARYEWSEAKREYAGPKGGGELPFMRVDGPEPYASEEYESFVPKQEEKK